MANSSEGAPRREHTSKQFDQELLGLRNLVLALGGLVEDQIGLAMQALQDNDTGLAQTVIRDDKKVNASEIEINELCTQILARRQPAAGDLRLVVAVLKTANDLERIGDDAKRIARAVLIMEAQYPRKAQLVPLYAFSIQVRERLKDTLNAFARIDSEAAFVVKERDDEIDKVYRDIMKSQIANMTEDPRSIPIALNLIWIAKALERIGDRSCNICEYVIYYALGKDIRHMSLEQAAQDIRNK